MLTPAQYRELARVAVQEALNALCDEGKIPDDTSDLVAYAMADYDSNLASWSRGIIADLPYTLEGEPYEC